MPNFSNRESRKSKLVSINVKALSLRSLVSNTLRPSEDRSDQEIGQMPHFEMMQVHKDLQVFFYLLNLQHYGKFNRTDNNCQWELGQTLLRAAPALPKESNMNQGECPPRWATPSSATWSASRHWNDADRGSGFSPNCLILRSSCPPGERTLLCLARCIHRCFVEDNLQSWAAWRKLSAVWLNATQRQYQTPQGTCCYRLFGPITCERVRSSSLFAGYKTARFLLFWSIEVQRIREGYATNIGTNLNNVLKEKLETCRPL